MRKIQAIAIILFFSLNVCAQFPFEKYPQVKYREYNDWKLFHTSFKGQKHDYILMVPDFFENHDSLKIIMTMYHTDVMEDSCIVTLYHKDEKIFDFVNYTIGSIFDDPIRIADINGDKKPDIKFIFRGWGCGAYNIYLDVVYFFQTTGNHLTKISYSDMMFENENRLERDIDKDGNYEIITQWFQSYGSHNYWVFNIYKYQNGGLVNVNYLDNYPIMIQLLNDENYKITNKISREKMKQFSKKLPDDYSKE